MPDDVGEIIGCQMRIVERGSKSGNRQFGIRVSRAWNLVPSFKIAAKVSGCDLKPICYGGSSTRDFDAEPLFDPRQQLGCRDGLAWQSRAYAENLELPLIAPEFRQARIARSPRRRRPHHSMSGFGGFVHVPSGCLV
jgi:hypothetical protein